MPTLSTATHNPTVGHDTAVSGAPSIRRSLHPDAAPPGRRETSTLPAVSTATHSRTDGHDNPAISARPNSARAWSTRTARHRELALQGCVELRIHPPTSLATHSERPGHDTARKLRAAATGARSSTSTGRDQTIGPAARAAGAAIHPANMQTAATSCAKRRATTTLNGQHDPGLRPCGQRNSQSPSTC